MVTQERHDQFRRDLAASKPYVDCVVDWLKRKGHTNIEVPDNPVAKTFAERMPDDGDIILHTDTGRRFRLEVKSRNLTYTCKEEFPFSTAIVCQVESFKRACNKDDMPFAYFCVEKKKRSMFICKVAETRHLWTEEQKMDGRDGVWKPFYMVPIEAVAFHSMHD